MLRNLLVTAALLVQVAPALAQPAPAGSRPDMGARMQQTRQACMADAQTFCGSVLNDHKARRECMMANQAKLSPGCRDAMAQMRALRQAHTGASGPGPQPR